MVDALKTAKPKKVVNAVGAWLICLERSKKCLSNFFVKVEKNFILGGKKTRESSVNIFDHFWKFFATIFPQKLPKYFVPFWDNFEKHSFLSETVMTTFGATLWKCGLLFYSSIWSHCSCRARHLTTIIGISYYSSRSHKNEEKTFWLKSKNRVPIVTTFLNIGFRLHIKSDCT